MTLRPAVFLDRDGTIVGERHYLADPAGVALIPGAIEAMTELRDAGFALVVVTNQAGIARGLYTLDDYHAVAARIDEVLGSAGVVVDGTWYCPHHPESTGPCTCRKPDTGMYREAAQLLGLDVQASYYVGDKKSDVLPAIELGGRGILVRTGYGKDHESGVEADVWVVDDVRGAARRILAEGAR